MKNKEKTAYEKIKIKTKIGGEVMVHDTGEYLLTKFEVLYRGKYEEELSKKEKEELKILEKIFIEGLKIQPMEIFKKLFKKK